MPRACDLQFYYTLLKLWRHCSFRVAVISPVLFPCCYCNSFYLCCSHAFTHALLLLWPFTCCENLGPHHCLSPMAPGESSSASVLIWKQIYQSYRPAENIVCVACLVILWPTSAMTEVSLSSRVVTVSTKSPGKQRASTDSSKVAN